MFPDSILMCVCVYAHHHTQIKLKYLQNIKREIKKRIQSVFGVRSILNGLSSLNYLNYYNSFDYVIVFQMLIKCGERIAI